MDDVIIELLPNEKGYGRKFFAGLHLGQMIISIYKLSPNSNVTHSEITNNFKQKATQILNSNKWLMSRLRNLRTPTQRLAMVISERHTNPDDYISVETDESVQNMDEIKSESEISFTTARSVTQRHTVGWSKDLWDKEDGKLCRLGQIWNPQKTTCYMFLVVNHCLTDGASLFQVWKMLAPEVGVTSLNPIRNQNFDKGLKNETSLLPEDCGMADLYGKANSTLLPALVIKGFCQGLKNTTFKHVFLKFDGDFIKKEKARFCTGDEFVSTNDVITSWFGNLIKKRNISKVTNTMVAVDCRSRIQGISENMVGNYLTIPFIRKSDLKTPKTVRNWINFVTAKGNSWKMPTYSEFRKYVGGVHTSWTKFYYHVEPVGLKHVLHFPVMPDSDIRLGPMPLGNELNIIIFKSAEEDVCCYIHSRRDDFSVKEILKEEIVKGQLMQV